MMYVWFGFGARNSLREETINPRSSHNPRS
jgi:hypothetical protein